MRVGRVRAWLGPLVISAVVVAAAGTTRAQTVGAPPAGAAAPPAAPRTMPPARAPLPSAGNAQLPPAPTYRFRIDSFRVAKTRALHVDTDYVSLQLNLGPKHTKPMGDVNDGVHDVGLYVDVGVPPKGGARMTYVILNSGASGDAVVNFLGGMANSLASLFNSNLGGLVSGGCDGIVAKGDRYFDALVPARQMASGPVSGEDYTPGTDSATGCGSNSRYYVRWSVSRI